MVTKVVTSVCKSDMFDSLARLAKLKAMHKTRVDESLRAAQAASGRKSSDGVAEAANETEPS